MRFTARDGILCLIVVASVVSGCVSLEEGTAQPPAEPSATSLPPTERPESVEATDVPVPTINPDVQRIFYTYQHTTNVFSVSIPETWAVRDDSTDERLLVVLEPPLGFASRVMIDIVYESGLTLNELAALRDGYLTQVYGGDTNYSQINQAELPDGRLEVTYQYNNPAGASGREVVYLSQSGPYFAALRVFTSNQEASIMADVMDEISQTFTLNPTARWGEPQVQIGADDLQVQGLNGWYDLEGNYRVTGRIYNDWVEDVGFLAVSAGVCDPNGVVLDENSVILVNDILPVNGVVPFEVQFGQIENEEPRPCLVQPRGEPASRLEVEPYTALEIPDDAWTVTLDEGEEPNDIGLAITGTVFNQGTQTVHLIDVIIAIYDADPILLPEARVIGYAVTTTDAAELDPGQASSFTFRFPIGELGADPATVSDWRIELWVQGNPLQPTPVP